MVRRLFIYVNLLCGFVCVASAGLWIGSRFSQVNMVWTSGTNHNQVISFKGAIYFVRNHDWWRREKLTVVIDRQPVQTSILEWPGMLLDSQSQWMGFARATGQWVSPLILVTQETEFTSDEISIPPKTMYRSTTPIEIYGIPYWFLVLLPALWIIADLYFIRRRVLRSSDERESIDIP